MSAQDITSIAAVIIAILALFIAIKEARETRKYNRLNARPRLEFKYEFVTAAGKIGLFLDNYGLGPALITSFKVYFEDAFIDTTYDKIWPSVFEKIPMDLDPKEYLTWTSYRSDTRSIPSGSRDELLIAGSHAISSRCLEIFNYLIPRLKIIIEYQSVYGENFTSVCEENPTGLLENLIAHAKEYEEKHKG